MTPVESWRALLDVIGAWHASDKEDMQAKRALHDGCLAYAAARGAATPAARPAAASTGGAVFPPYGRSKGLPVAGASRRDLDFYRSGCLRTLGDESKSRWHEKERALLAAIDAELGLHADADRDRGSLGGEDRGEWMRDHGDL